MTGLFDIPLEIVEHILLFLDPLHVAAFSQTCSGYYNLVYNSEDQHLWREMYLLQPFDDPRLALSSLGQRLPAVDWKIQLQQIIRARTVLTSDPDARPDDLRDTFRTLIDMVCNIPALPGPEVIDKLSLNHAWLAEMLRKSTILDDPPSESSTEEHRLRARLHSYLGLTSHDFLRANRIRSLAFVYAMYNYKYDNDFGPYLMDGTGRVNWVHIRAIHHTISMHIVPADADTESANYHFFPMGLTWCQSIIPPGIDLDNERDWAGVEGTWQCGFCFCDHRELLAYNNLNPDEDPRPDAPNIFHDPTFVEAFRVVNLDLWVLSTEPDPSHPTRPRLNIAGTVAGRGTVVGYVQVTPDDQIRWHFKTGQGGHTAWSSEGVQVGNVRSKYGVLGSWTTVAHDPLDPVGPFWLWKDTERVEDLVDA